jgi:hypothetical protein
VFHEIVAPDPPTSDAVTRLMTGGVVGMGVVSRAMLLFPPIAKFVPSKDAVPLKVRLPASPAGGVAVYLRVLDWLSKKGPHRIAPFARFPPSLMLDTRQFEGGRSSTA